MEEIDNKSGMTPEEIVSEISFQKSAIYKIIVQGELSKRFSKILGGMQLNILREKGKRPVSVLIGELTDQSSLLGVINTLYDNHMSIISVNVLGEK